MAAMSTSSSSLLRASQKSAAPRAARAFASSSSAVKPALRRWTLRAVEDDVDLDQAEAVVRQVMREASIEKEFLEGVAAPETAQYLTRLASRAVELDAGDAADAGAGAVLEAVLGDVAAGVDAAALADTDVLEETGPKPYLSQEDVEPDVLTGMDNAKAVEALRVVGALKLSRDELADGLVPRDWDTQTVDWFAAKKSEDLPLPEYRLNILWFEKNIAVAVDQVYARGGVSPLTEYFFWPRKDAWEELKNALEGRPWISETEKVVLLNRLTEVINFWQDDEAARPTLDEARATFGDCIFTGASA